MKGITTTFLFLFSVSIAVHASVLKCCDTAYRGQSFELFIQSDPITGNDSVVAHVFFDDNGCFNTEVNLSETYMVYAYAGVYRIYFFVEPGKEYQVVMPPYRPKTEADLINPFFKPVEVHLATQVFNETELNMQLRMFNDAFLPYFNKHVDKIFTDNDFETLDKDIAQIDKPFSKSKNSFFNDYRNYKYGLLRMYAYQHKSKAISDQYFKNMPFLYNNPAYIELFNKVYDGYFTYFSRADEQKSLSLALLSERTSEAVCKALRADEVLQPAELLNMVMLKGLHDEFYNDTYARNSLLEVLSDFIKTSSDPIQVGIARKIYLKVTRLLAGYQPPGFILFDKDSNMVSPDNFKGKYLYLNFCACFSYSCLNEFVMLQRLYEKHNQYLEIVTVIVDEDVEAMKDFVKRSGYSWVFLHFDRQPQVLRDYDIRALPTYFLIGPDGKLVMSPAASPAEEFEARLFKELKAKGML
ncbi:MAG: redoxin domain-containing protein [Bacteroidales bacterium]|nr:redoxin domain-containing protein [Bacteroidales bacterium]